MTGFSLPGGALRWRRSATSVLIAWSTVGAGAELVPLFPAADDEFRQGFVRVVNHSTVGGTVDLVAVDDAGDEVDGLVLQVGPGETVHFNSDDLENGNPDKGLSGAAGAGDGDWRLELTSQLDIEVLAYIRTADGFLTAVHDTVPVSADGHRVAIFNPGSNDKQVSRLRIINPGSTPATVTIEGTDDRGRRRRTHPRHEPSGNTNRAPHQSIHGAVNGLANSAPLSLRLRCCEPPRLPARGQLHRPWWRDPDHRVR